MKDTFKINLSVIIISGNSEDLILDCLKSCDFAEEIILVAANSTDSTKNIVRQYSSKIKIIETFDEYNKNFSKWRNLGFEAATQPWIFYLDTDERLTPSLKSEIIDIINIDNQHCSCYVVPRQNHFLGHRVKFGGSYPDYVKRFYRTKNFHGYTGILHEEPLVDGQFGYLKNPLIHYTHRDLSSMIQKSLVWTDLEAQALFSNRHPPVVWWRFFRMMLTKIFERLIKQQMWRDGIVGWISVIFESFDTYMIYARLWELQQSPQNR